jgi:indole-3-glycerol phosphate synthase / phosphoribosylanthranilate isomerase
MSILAEIVAHRKKRVAADGPSEGIVLPLEREQSVVPFPEKKFLICEVKRRSPSKGPINTGLDPVKQAVLYSSSGAGAVSVLTEEEYFGGSLRDLMAIKKACPNVPVLRKDFLLTRDDIKVSYLAGADAVLLIASILTKKELADLYTYAKELKMEVLFEVHDGEDVRKAETIKPCFTGINTRDLKTFTIDKTLPLTMARQITWDTSLVYESGIGSREDALLAGSSGFAAALVGEAVVCNPDLVPVLSEALLEGAHIAGGRSFWQELYGRRRRPFIKICGLCCIEDVLYADKLGADILGFILAPSPRKTGYDFVASLPETRALKAGVVVLEKGRTALPEDAARLVSVGKLDVIQFHGDEQPGDCADIAFPYYKALRIRDRQSAERIKTYRCPRILADTYVQGAAGGTGKTMSGSLIKTVGKNGPLWMAGGIGADNVAALIQEYSPELIDASSRLEERPGKKNPALLDKFFKEVYGQSQTE